VLAVDLHRRKAWRQGGAGHHMLRTDGGLIVVEKRKAAAAHVHGAYAETYCLGIDAVEIDQTLERTLERVRVVIAGKIWKRDPIQHRPRRKEAGLPEHQRGERTQPAFGFSQRGEC